MYGSHFWTRDVSSNDLPIISDDSSHVFSEITGKSLELTSRVQKWEPYIEDRTQWFK
ncbi:hypothetical protein T08_4675 [Trichinella sp. T8]|nr:hypothetical protein T08_4675 [Trichinella sp. T8]